MVYCSALLWLHQLYMVFYSISFILHQILWYHLSGHQLYMVTLVLHSYSQLILYCWIFRMVISRLLKRYFPLSSFHIFLFGVSFVFISGESYMVFDRRTSFGLFMVFDRYSYIPFIFHRNPPINTSRYFFTSDELKDGGMKSKPIPH